MIHDHSSALQFRNYINHLTFPSCMGVSKSNSRGHKLLTEAGAAGLKWLIDTISQNYTSHQQHAEKKLENSMRILHILHVSAVARQLNTSNFSVQMK